MKNLLKDTFIFLNTLEIYNQITHKTFLITVGDGKGRLLSLHKSIFIGPQFNLDMYYEMIRNSIDKVSGYGLDIQDIKTIEILVIDHDRVWVNSPSKKSLGKRSYSTISKHITPIKSTNKNPIAAPLAVMNIKTISINDVQEPCLITITNSTINNSFISQPFIMKNNIKLALSLNLLWAAVFKYVIRDHNIKTIFVHNLAENGVYIYKYLFQSFSRTSITSIIDNDNKFITITWKIQSRTITWLDSNRIFPVTVVDLCNIFEVKMSLMNPITQDMIYSSKNWILQADAVNEGISLYNALIKAQTQYLDIYAIDITKVVSTSNLSLQIYRKHFMTVSIPILKYSIDLFVRNSYYGGATE